MKSIARAFQGYQKGPAVVDPEYDDAHNKFMDTMKATDTLVQNMDQFEKVRFTAISAPLFLSIDRGWRLRAFACLVCPDLILAYTDCLPLPPVSTECPIHEEEHGAGHHDRREDLPPARRPP